MITIQIAEMYPQENVKISITCLINRILTPSMIDMFDHLTYRNTLTFVGPSDAPQFSGRTFRNTNLLKHFEMWPTKQNYYKFACYIYHLVPSICHRFA